MADLLLSLRVQVSHKLKRAFHELPSYKSEQSICTIIRNSLIRAQSSGSRQLESQAPVVCKLRQSTKEWISAYNGIFARENSVVVAEALAGADF